LAARRRLASGRRRGGCDRRTRSVAEETVALVGLLLLCARRVAVEAVARRQGPELDRLARHVEREQIPQVVVAAAGHHLDAPHAVGALAGVEWLHRAELGDLLEQIE